MNDFSNLHIYPQHSLGPRMWQAYFTTLCLWELLDFISNVWKEHTAGFSITSIVPCAGNVGKTVFHMSSFPRVWAVASPDSASSIQQILHSHIAWFCTWEMWKSLFLNSSPRPTLSCDLGKGSGRRWEIITKMRLSPNKSDSPTRPGWKPGNRTRLEVGAEMVHREVCFKRSVPWKFLTTMVASYWARGIGGSRLFSRSKACLWLLSQRWPK